MDKIGFLVGFQKGRFGFRGTISGRISEGTFRPPGNLLLLGILHNFRHEVRWCFTVSAVFQKRCLAAAFLLIYRQQQQSKLEIKILDKIGFLVGFQKGRFGLRGTCYCDRFCVIFGTKLGGVLLFRLCFKKGVWLLLSYSFIGSSSSQNWRSKLDKIGFLIGFQKRRFGLRGTCYCD